MTEVPRRGAPAELPRREEKTETWARPPERSPPRSREGGRATSRVTALKPAPVRRRHPRARVQGGQGRRGRLLPPAVKWRFESRTGRRPRRGEDSGWRAARRPG